MSIFPIHGSIQRINYGELTMTSMTSSPERDTTWFWIVGILLAVLACLILTLCATLAGVGLWLQTQEANSVTPHIIYVTATPTLGGPAQSPQPMLVPGEDHAQATPTPLPLPDGRGRVTVLEATRVPLPTRDLRVLGMRFNPDLGEVPPIVNPTPPTYEVGDVRSFYVTDTDNNRHFQIEAELKYKTEHAYFWFERGVRVDMDEVREAARFFEEQIYPTNRRVFGEEWEPGVDNDPHITFLHARGLGASVAGYFSSADSFPRSVSPYSNEMDMFYINLDATEPGDPFYLDVIAHEFQHMIHWYQDRNEETWLNEGLSVLAEVVNGFHMGGFLPVFLSNPDLQLTGWNDENSTPHYGAAGLFAYYFYEHYGEEAVRRLARHPKNGMDGFDAVLADLGWNMTSVDLFADWVVANLVNNPRLGDGRFGYRREVTERADVERTVSEYPAILDGTVAQYGTDYLRLDGQGTVTVAFRGVDVNRVAPVRPHSGQFVMWGNRGDDSDSRLYTEIDLTNAVTATLSFWTWYDIEELWDFAYVVVSTDGGKHWEMLESPRMTRENPYGNNLGVGYTGVSGGGDTPEWVFERIDLSPYVGQKVLVGFEYVTDDAFTRPGFFVDDVRIEGVGFADDFEQSLEKWVQKGFLRTDTFVPQRYIVQVIQVKGDKMAPLQRYIIVDGETLEFTIEDIDKWNTYIAVSAFAPLTWETADYSLSIKRR